MSGSADYFVAPFDPQCPGRIICRWSQALRPCTGVHARVTAVCDRALPLLGGAVRRLTFTGVVPHLGWRHGAAAAAATRASARRFFLAPPDRPLLY
jgi:hypothetical protein